MNAIERFIHKTKCRLIHKKCDHIDFLTIKGKEIICANCGFIYDTIK